MDPIVQAICHAHANGVLHRDLKPGNILLQRKSAVADCEARLTDFEPKVTDFGLAKLIDETLWQHEDSSAMSSDRRTLAAEPLLTQLGRQPGTPAYMAPEQFDGSVGLVGLPVDIWALGVIFYELLTGRRPFPAEHRAELLPQIGTSFLPPRAHQPRIDAALERLTLRCLNRDPARRPTAVELAHDLARYRRPGPVRRLASAALGIWQPVWIVLARRGRAPLSSSQVGMAMRSIYELTTEEAYHIVAEQFGHELPPLDAVENEDWGRDYVLQKLLEHAPEELAAVGLFICQNKAS